MHIYSPAQPAWRNWQTRRTQNPVSSKDVQVRPLSPVALKFDLKHHVLAWFGFIGVYFRALRPGMNELLKLINKSIKEHSAASRL